MSNAFGRGTKNQDRLNGVADDVNGQQFDDASKSAENYTRSIEEVNLALRSLKNESSGFTDVTKNVQQLMDAITNMASTIRQSNISESVKNDLEAMKNAFASSTTEIEQKAIAIQDKIRQAFKKGTSNDQKIEIFNQIFEDINKLDERLNTSKSAFDAYKDRARELIPGETSKSINDAAEAVSKLDENLSKITNKNTDQGIGNLGKPFKSLRDDVNETADTLKSKSSAIVAETLKILNAGNEKDNGTALVLKQMSMSVEDLGMKSSQHQKQVANMYVELNKMGGIDTSKLTKGLEDYYSSMEQLTKAKADFAKVLKDDDLNQSADVVHNHLTRIMAMQQAMVQQGKQVTSDYEKIGKNKLGLENYQQFNNTLGDIIKSYDDLARSAKNAGYEVDNAIDDDDYEDFAQGRRNKRGFGSKLKDKMTMDNFLSGAGNLGGGFIDASKHMLGIAGLGALTDLTGIGRGIFQADQEYGRRSADSALGDMAAGGLGSWNRGAYDSAISTGMGWNRSTHGLIAWDDLEKNRQSLTRNTMGHYGSSDAAGDARDMGQLAETSTLYQKGFGISEGAMNGAINTFYKELKMDLSDTEFMLSKVAGSAMALNVPFEKHLKQVEALALQYKQWGLGVDEALNATNNLMGNYGMNSADANAMASAIGGGLGSMNDGMAAYTGMMYGGASDPYAAMWKYQDKWNKDGSVKEGWVDYATNMSTGMAGMYKDMAGGDPNLQKYLMKGFYQNSMGMDAKTSTILASTNDPDEIRDILSKSAGGALDSGAAKSPEDMNSDLLNSIESASEELSGVDKSLNALKNVQMTVAISNHDLIDKLTNHSEAIYAVGDTINEGFGDFLKKLEDLSIQQETLTRATEALTLAMLAGAVAGPLLKGLGKAGGKIASKGYKKAKDAYKKRKDVKNRPGKKTDDSDNDKKKKHYDDDDVEREKKHNKKNPKSKRNSKGQLLLESADDVVEKIGKGGKLKGFLKGAGKIGTKTLGAATSLLTVPAWEFGSKLGDGKISKKEAKEASVDSGVSLGTIGVFAGSGAAMGSVVPVVGTAVGAGIGAGIGGAVDLVGHDKIKDMSTAAVRKTKKVGKSIKKGASDFWEDEKWRPSKWFSNDKEDVKKERETQEYRKNKAEELARQKEIKDINKNHFDKSIESLREAKALGVDIGDYVKDKYPKTQTEQKKVLDETKKLTGLSKDELSKIAESLGLGLPALLGAIQNLNMGGVGTGSSGGIAGGNYIDQVAKLISANEGSYFSVNPADGSGFNKALSIGKFQWHGERAKDLLLKMKKEDPKLFEKYLGGSQIAKDLKKSDSFWNKRTLSEKERIMLSGYLSTQVSERVQDEQIKEDAQGYIDKAQQFGVTDPQAMAYFADLYNQRPASAISIAAKGTSLEALHKNAMADSIMGKYADRRKKAYESAKAITTDAGGEGLADAASWYYDTYNVTSRFGDKESFRAKAHNGVDFDGKIGDKLISLAAGKVISTSTGHRKGEKNSLGNHVKIQHADGTVSIYGHMDSVGVKNGQSVGAGAYIGTMGNTGSVFSTTGDGSHLHLGVMQNGKYIDPEAWMKKYGRSVSGGDAGGEGLADGSSTTKPLSIDVGRKSVYGMGSDASWKAKGMYSGSLAYSTQGTTNIDEKFRHAGKNNFNINIYADPGKESEYYKNLAKYIENAVRTAEKNFANQYAKDKKYNN